AEDGIRDFHVTGVQTCALPISIHRFHRLPLGQEIGDLVERANDEIDELHLADRTQPHVAHAACRADDGALADGRVNHTLPAKPFEQALAGLERAAVDADVFAHQQDRGIALHLLKHGLPNGLKKSDLPTARCESIGCGPVSASHAYLRAFREAPAAAALAFFGAVLAAGFAAALADRPLFAGLSMTAGASPK